MKTPISTEKFEEKQRIVSDALKMAEALVEALANAECCETADDFVSSLEEAKECYRQLRGELNELTE